MRSGVKITLFGLLTGSLFFSSCALNERLSRSISKPMRGLEGVEIDLNLDKNENKEIKTIFVREGLVRKVHYVSFFDFDQNGKPDYILVGEGYDEKYIIDEFYKKKAEINQSPNYNPSKNN